MRRDGLSLADAARAVHTTPNTVKRHAGRALERTTSGRYQVRERDPLLRPMETLTTYGRRPLLIRDSRTASAIGAHWDAVRRYVETGDDRGLRYLKRKSFRFEKVLYLFELDTDVIDRLARAGELRFESIYAAT